MLVIDFFFDFLFYPILLLACFYYDFHHLLKAKERCIASSKTENPKIYQFKIGRSQNRHIFVTYYYPVLEGKQRHPIEVYQTNAQRFFKIIRLPTIVFTQKKYLKLLNISDIPSNFIVNEKYDSPYDICHLDKYKEKYKVIAREMQKKVKYIIADIFGAIWNAKLCLLNEVLENTNYSHVHWLDIGIFKNTQYDGHKLNDTSKIDKVYNQIGDKIFFGSIYSPNNIIVVPFEQYNIRKQDFFTGGYIGGSRKIIISFYKDFFGLHDYFINKSQFVCRDEYIYTTYCIYNPKMCSFIHMKDSSCFKWISTISFLFSTDPCKFKTGIYFLKHEIINGKNVLNEFPIPS